MIVELRYSLKILFDDNTGEDNDNTGEDNDNTGEDSDRGTEVFSLKILFDDAKGRTVTVELK